MTKREKLLEQAKLLLNEPDFEGNAELQRTAIQAVMIAGAMMRCALGEDKAPVIPDGLLERVAQLRATLGLDETSWRREVQKNLMAARSSCVISTNARAHYMLEETITELLLRLFF